MSVIKNYLHNSFKIVKGDSKFLQHYAAKQKKEL